MIKEAPPRPALNDVASEYILEWMPTLKPRTPLNHAALAIPIMAALTASGGILVAIRRIACENEDTLEIVTAGAALAFAGTFFIHGAGIDSRPHNPLPFVPRARPDVV